ncbi:MAG: pyridoxamine 5'-phosphate oxidase family protein [Candidatus Micrarchaeota archaeon]|nr:pyridoxamine 5'-phosphate oxidase family protein [Candidatus Micrarchaeota archaeon]
MDTRSKLVQSFMRMCDVGVLSYISGRGKPSSALMEYASKGYMLLFCTSRDSRKYSNIKNRNVAFEIHKGERTLRYEGLSIELKQGKELEEAKSLLWKKDPLLKQWEKKEGLAYFAIRPSWICYMDFDTKPDTKITRSFGRVKRKT